MARRVNAQAFSFWLFSVHITYPWKVTIEVFECSARDMVENPLVGTCEESSTGTSFLCITDGTSADFFTEKIIFSATKTVT